MGKIAFIFSGQGAQVPGMGKSFYEAVPAVKRLYEEAERIRPGTMKDSFYGTAESLRQTQVTQPCLYLADLSAALAMQIMPDGVAGFSLGEIPALAFAGAFSYAEGFRIVCERGYQMATSRSDTAMAAVLKLPEEKVEALCGGFAHVYPVNYNCPGQLVVSGLADEVNAFTQKVREAGGRAVPLQVSGAFHSPFMREASQRFGAYLRGNHMASPLSLPVYSNETARLYGEDILAQMESQIRNPVRWEKEIRRMATDGYDTFIETGVGTTLKKLIEKILPEAKTYAVFDMESAEAVRKELKGAC